MSELGNKLGCFVKEFEATRRESILPLLECVEMDLSRALPGELILEVFDEEWLQTIDYEHIPFRCRKCHEHGHLFRDCPLTKIENKSKANTMKDTKSFHMWHIKEKQTKRG